MILKQRLSDTQLMTLNNSTWSRCVSVKRASKGDELSVKLISQEWGKANSQRTLILCNRYYKSTLLNVDVSW